MMKTMKSTFLTGPRKAFLMLLLILAISFAHIKESQAQCCGCCTCMNTTIVPDLISAGWFVDWISINLHIFVQLYLHRLLWFDLDFWQLYMLPAMAMMGEQMSATGLQQMQIIGSFLDADELMETQRDIQKMQALAHKEYHPSIEMCEFGSRIKSLATSERQGELVSLAMSQRSMDRMLGHKGSTSPFGRTEDIKNRLKQFKEKYCDRSDSNAALSSVCTGPIGAAITETVMDRYNKDIDYPRALAKPWTIKVNTTDDTFTNDEEDLFALQANLYGFFTAPAMDPQKIKNLPNSKVNSAQQAYMDMRSYVAKKNVAENSFNAMAALKAEGTDGSKNFLKAYLRELGVSSGNIDKYLGENPSYNAQMEILTKLTYQDPAFYTALYDKPANVERKGVAIQAIGLMQKFDLWKSYLRTEASLSILLELSVQQLQNEIEESISGRAK